MTNITANDVKILREMTSAGMMDCKKALVECAGNMEEAADWLRKKGMAVAAKKSGRTTAEGLVAARVSGNKGALLELNCETDFVAKNEKFQALANDLVELFLHSDKTDVESFKSSTTSSGRQVSEEIVENVSVIGENINLRRVEKLEVKQGVVVSYMHNTILPNLGKIGVLVGIESSIAADKLQEFGLQVAMHIAAFRPESLEVSDLDPQLVAKEKEILREQALASGKPIEVVEKMLDGRMSKFYEQVVLLEQAFVMDQKLKVKDALAAAVKELGGEIKITGFKRLTLGEGVVKTEE